MFDMWYSQRIQSNRHGLVVVSIKFFKTSMPKLCAISVLSKCPTTYPSESSLSAAIPNTVPRHRHTFKPVPQSMAGLPLVQRSEDSKSNTSGQTSARGSEHTSVYVVDGIDFYVFSKDNIEHHSWTSDGVRQELGIHLYQPYLLNLF